MSAGQRIRSFLLGLFTLLLSLLMILFPEDGFPTVALIISISLIIFGIRRLFYYFTMARHMVGGKSALYVGMIVLDLGIFAYTLDQLPKIYVVLYLLGIHAFAGAIEVLRSLEAKRVGAVSWRMKLVSGLINIVISVLCVIFLRSTNVIVYIYAAGLAWTSCARIFTAFRKTAIIYIQ